MRTLKIILWSMLVLSVAAGLVRADGQSTGSDRETDRLLKAKEYIFERSWDQAREQLELYLTAYPDGQYRDEALYWLAQSINKLAKQEKRAGQVILLKEESIQKLNDLIEEFPKSMWLDDGKTLKVELSGELALMGKKEYLAYLEKFIATENKDLFDVKITALNKMIELEPEAAIPVLEDIIHSEKDPSVRKKGVYLLGRHFPDESVVLLNDIEKNDPDPTVRKEAGYWIRRGKISRMPVQLNYFCFTAELDDKETLARIKPNQANMFELPRIGSSGSRKIKQAIQRCFDDNLIDVQFVSNGVRGTEMDWYGTQISHRVAGFRVQLIEESLEKNLDHFKGEARFYNLTDGEEFVVPFTVNDSREQLIAMRQGSQVALMLLQFESQEEELDLDDEPIYSTEFSNVLGCVVFSSRQGWNLEEMTKKTGVIDYGRAKAEIPGDSGKWILTGNILLDRDKRTFIARRAELVDPRGKTVAQAPRLKVPVDNPSGYEQDGN